MDEKRFNPCNTDACKERCDNFGVRCEEICIDEIESLRARVAELKKERDSFYMDYRLKCDAETKRLEVILEALKASQGDPVAWRTFDGEGGYSLMVYEDNETYRDDYIKRNGDRYRDWVEPLYTSTPTIPEGYLLAEKACREFIRKVENGEARSTRSYAAMKMAIDLIDTIGWSTQKKWGE